MKMLPMIVESIQSGGGVVSSSRNVAELWFSLPQVPRFFAAGTIGNGILYVMDQYCYKNIIPTLFERIPSSLSKSLSGSKESVSFFISYFVQILAQHSINAMLVFGLDTISTKEKYIKSLIGTYTTLGTCLVLSTIFNLLLIKYGVAKNIAFWITLYGFAIVNYFILKMVTSSSSKEDTSTNASANGSLNKVTRGGGDSNGSDYYFTNDSVREDTSLMQYLIRATLPLLLDEQLLSEKQLLHFVKSTI